jgi:cell shape-determining protein MreC
MNYEELIIEKLNDIKDDQRNLRIDNKELKHDLTKRMDQLDKDNKELKKDINNIKENHLKHIDNSLVKMERDLYWLRLLMVGILGSILGMILKQIFF